MDRDGSLVLSLAWTTVLARVFRYYWAGHGKAIHGPFWNGPGPCTDHKCHQSNMNPPSNEKGPKHRYTEHNRDLGSTDCCISPASVARGMPPMWKSSSYCDCAVSAFIVREPSSAAQCQRRRARSGQEIMSIIVATIIASVTWRTGGMSVFLLRWASDSPGPNKLRDLGSRPAGVGRWKVGCRYNSSGVSKISRFGLARWWAVVDPEDKARWTDRIIHWIIQNDTRRIELLCRWPSGDMDASICCRDLAVESSHAALGYIACVDATLKTFKFDMSRGKHATCSSKLPLEYQRGISSSSQSLRLLARDLHRHPWLRFSPSMIGFGAMICRVRRNLDWASRSSPVSHPCTSALRPRTELHAVYTANISPPRRIVTLVCQMWYEVVRWVMSGSWRIESDRVGRVSGLKGSRLGHQSVGDLSHPFKLGPRDKLSCSVIGAAAISWRPTSLDVQARNAK